ncbi:MAG: hypothetical protein JNJ42_19585 [Burkholderiaceae bacterium]|nr:hypothetical protein [Burkholderiaceae bacterium]
MANVDGSHDGPTRSSAITGGPPSAGMACPAITTEVGTVRRLTSVTLSVLSPAGIVITGAAASGRNALVALQLAASATGR